MPSILAHLRSGGAALCIVFFASMGHAASPVAGKVLAPHSMEQWRGWIEQGNPARDCPGQVQGACLWLGPLELTEGKSGWGGRFAAVNLMSSPTPARLPGDVGSWPAWVRVDGSPAVIGMDSQGAYVMLGAQARANVTFDFTLARSSSAALPIPQGFPMVGVAFANGETRYLDAGQPVDLSTPKPAEQAPGARLSAAKEEKANVRVSRLIQDGQVPLMVTRVKIENGGARRLVTIEGIVPEGSAVFQMQALGAKLVGRSLSVEAAPGVSALSITSALDPDLAIRWGSLSSTNSHLADKQYVFIQSNESFRKIAAQGEAVDPKSLDPVLSFGALPAYALGLDGSGLALAPKALESQGEASSSRVRNEGWLDFEGNEVFMVERLDFVKSIQGWFEPVGAWRATQATTSGSPAVVSKSEKGEAGRVSTAAGMGSLEVGLRSPSSLWLGIPAIATEGVVAKSSTALIHIPLGWRVLGVFGAGQSDSGWMASLSLWDWFLMIVAVWFAKSLMGWRKAGAVLVAMALGRLFLGAPFAIYLPLFAALALSRHLPVGGAKTASFVVVGLLSAALFAQAAPYTMSRIQKTMHTALEDGAQPGEGDGTAGAWRLREAAPEAESGVAPAPASMAAMAPDQAPSMSGVSSMMAKGAANGISERDAVSSIVQASAPTVAGAQAGQGVPSWSSGIAIAIRYPAPASSSSVAKILLMPAWLVKVSALLSMCAMWITLGSIFEMAVQLWRQGSKDSAGAPVPAAISADQKNQGGSQ